jgi:UDP-N-acetylmuramate--alanine ligase
MHNVLDRNKTKHIHFVGLGGIGVSALARMMKYHGKHVSGSDKSMTPITRDLENLGIRVRPGHDEHHVPLFADLVVYSPAITPDNPELVRARALSIPTLSYPEVLGEISKEAFTIAVSGTHGKTTTTAMIADVLAKDISPTVIVGSLLKGGRSNFVPGHTKRFLVEACEYKRSFLHLRPSVLVITNIDEDHLDYYKDLKDIQSAFRELALKVPVHGAIVCDTSDPIVQEILAGISVPILNYMAHYNPNRELFVFGEHNTKNAAIAHTVGDFFDVPEETINSALANFQGTWRRSEHKGRTTRGTEVYDDYAHHPKEISTTLAGFKKRFPDKNIVVVFQPHLYSRTKIFFNDFVDSLQKADRILLAPIYAAREPYDASISHHMLGDVLRQYGKKAESYESLDALTHVLSRTVQPNDVVITVGAGDIYKVGEKLL